MTAQRIVADQTGDQAVRTIDNRHRHPGLGRDLRRCRIVTAGMGDHQAGAFIGQFAQCRAHIAVAEPFRRQEFEIVFFGHRAGGINALLVPTIIGALFRHQHGDLLHHVASLGADADRNHGCEYQPGYGGTPRRFRN